MSNINNAYEKHKVYIYDDGYTLASPWSSAGVVDRPNGEKVEAEIARIEDRILGESNGIINDDDVYAGSTWSASKVNTEIAELPQIDDVSTPSTTTLWSSYKAALCRQRVRTIKAGEEAHLDTFYGFFAIVKAAATTEGIIGIASAGAGTVVYLQNNYYREDPDNPGEYIGLATLEFTMNGTYVTNHTDEYIVVYYFSQ